MVKCKIFSGSHFYDYGNKHVEHFETNQWGYPEWTIKPDFPFVSTFISCYSMATLNDELFIFGKNYFFLNRNLNIIKVEYGMVIIPIPLPNIMVTIGL